MCLAVIPAIIAIASAAASYQAAKQQASAQNEYYQKNSQASIRAFEDSVASTQAKFLSDAETSSEQTLRAKQEGLRARSSALAAADSSMTGGLSVDAIMQTAAFGMAQEQHALTTDLANRGYERDDQLRAAQHNATARINSVRQAQDPSMVPYVLSGLAGSMTRVDSKGATYGATTY
jgi:hypothetical protein